MVDADAATVTVTAITCFTFSARNIYYIDATLVRFVLIAGIVVVFRNSFFFFLIICVAGGKDNFQSYCIYLYSFHLIFVCRCFEPLNDCQRASAPEKNNYNNNQTREIKWYWCLFRIVSMHFIANCFCMKTNYIIVVSIVQSLQMLLSFEICVSVSVCLHFVL